MVTVSLEGNAEIFKQNSRKLPSSRIDGNFWTFLAINPETSRPALLKVYFSSILARVWEMCQLQNMAMLKAISCGECIALQNLIKPK